MPLGFYSNNAKPRLQYLFQLLSGNAPPDNCWDNGLRDDPGVGRKTQGRSFRICPLVSGLQAFYQEMTPSVILFLSDPVLMVYFYYESYKTYKCTINT